MKEEYLKYKDVFLIPKHSNLYSRSRADTSVNFLGNKFNLPIIPANMKDVIDENIAIKLASDGYFYIMHRWFGYPDDESTNIGGVVDFIQLMNSKKLLTSISVGIGLDWLMLIDRIAENKWQCDYITIDVAHADHEGMINIINHIRDKLPNTKIIAGNVATPEGCSFLIKQGVDAIKVGIGGGSICSTANKTGFHIPMFTCVLQCVDECNRCNIPVIADGGIKEFGDISKALVAGATMVMAGGIFAECIDSPAMVINGKKQYRGSTSFELKGKNNHIEGRNLELSYSVDYTTRLNEIKQALQSSISYAGGSDLTAFNFVQYIVVK